MSQKQMNFNKLSWHVPGRSTVSTIGTCSLCNFGPGEHDLGKLVAIGYRPDNNEPILAHEGHIGTTLVPADNMLLGYHPTASKQTDENIWSFASKFRYIAAAQTDSTTTSTPTNPAQGGANQATVQQTFPTMNVKAPETAQRFNAGPLHTDDGAPVPPKPFVGTE